MEEKKEVWVKQFREEDLARVPGIMGKFKRYANPSKPGQKLIAALGRLEPGEDMGWHSHPEEEIFFVISGSGLVRWEEENKIYEAEIHPGYGFYKEGNVPHQMVNTGSEPLLGLAAKASTDE
jgi:quercetin dioxygenase-like cupin family protein